MIKRPQQIWIDKFDFIANKRGCSDLFKEDCIKWGFIKKVNTIRKQEKLPFNHVCEVLIIEVEPYFRFFKKVFSEKPEVK